MATSPTKDFNINYRLPVEPKTKDDLVNVKFVDCCHDACPDFIKCCVDEDTVHEVVNSFCTASHTSSKYLVTEAAACCLRLPLFSIKKYGFTQAALNATATWEALVKKADACHSRLAKPWSEKCLADFERRLMQRLPFQLRHMLLHLGPSSVGFQDRAIAHLASQTFLWKDAVCAVDDDDYYGDEYDDDNDGSCYEPLHNDAAKPVPDALDPDVKEALKSRDNGLSVDERLFLDLPSRKQLETPHGVNLLQGTLWLRPATRLGCNLHVVMSGPRRGEVWSTDASNTVFVPGLDPQDPEPEPVDVWTAMLHALHYD